MLSSPPPTRWPFTDWVDSLGGAGAFLCAIHCAALPLLIALVPALGLTAFAGSAFEPGFVVFATVLGLGSLGLGFRRHRAYRALMFLLPGLLLVWLGAMLPAIHDQVSLHAVVMSVGGTLIAVAHLINLRLSHGHVHDAGCVHGH